MCQIKSELVHQNNVIIPYHGVNEEEGEMKSDVRIFDKNTARRFLDSFCTSIHSFAHHNIINFISHTYD